MNNKYILFLIFLTANFGALGIGTILMNEGPTSNWYTSLNQAPWTPSGWVFGAAWTTIMLLLDRKSTRLNSSHITNSYAVFCLKKKKRQLLHYDVYKTH